MLLEVRDLTKKYSTAAGDLLILDHVNLSLDQGQTAAIMGPSGSGKSTLLYILGALDSPSSGSVLIDGTDPHKLNDRELASFRNRKVGFVFQDHCLLPQCSVLENVLTPTMVAASVTGVEDKARELINAVGLDSRIHHRPAELSGGEKQRAAIARALVLNPRLLLCDEPTGNLDRQSADNVADLLINLQRLEKTAMVVVTHSADLASRFASRYEVFERQLRRTSG
jgi:lipoprotein-releasing system ATP-binding protein